MLIKKLLMRLLFPETHSESAYIKALREKYHIDIGDHCRIWSPNHTFIDKQRGHMLHIGDYCKITQNVTILTHDYSRGVYTNMEGCGNAGEAAYTYIGNNVFIGVNATILMGAHIGDNSIIGAGAVVSGSFPDNVVIAGNPAKIICSTEDFYKKRKSNEFNSAELYVKCWRNTYGKDPTIYDMTNAFSWLYIPHIQDSIEKYPEFFDLSAVNKDILYSNFLNSDAMFASFDDFLQECKEK